MCGAFGFKVGEGGGFPKGERDNTELFSVG